MATLADTVPAVLQSSAASDLQAIRSSDCSLAIWQRNAIPGLAALLAGDPQDIRFTCAAARLRPALASELSSKGFGASNLHADLIDDVDLLAKTYASILELDEIEVRLEIVTTDSCRKWHADYVTARLITTYVGSGTQWLGRKDADRVRNGLAPEQIGTLSAGDVGIFKGKLATDHPAVHRSPPIGDSGEQRLLLVLNPAQRG